MDDFAQHNDLTDSDSIEEVLYFPQSEGKNAVATCISMTQSVYDYIFDEKMRPHDVESFIKEAAKDSILFALGLRETK